MIAEKKLQAATECGKPLNTDEDLPFGVSTERFLIANHVTTPGALSLDLYLINPPPQMPKAYCSRLEGSKRVDHPARMNSL